MAYNKSRGNKEPLQYRITQHVGVLSYGNSSWSTQVNFVDWGRGIVLDIRPWDYAQAKMGKGTTLTREEAIRMRDMLNGLNLGDVEPLPYPEAPNVAQPGEMFDNGWGSAPDQTQFNI